MFDKQFHLTAFSMPYELLAELCAKEIPGGMGKVFVDGIPSHSFFDI